MAMWSVGCGTFNREADSDTALGAVGGAGKEGTALG